MVECRPPWLGMYWGEVVYGGRDIGVVSKVLKLGWGGWVCGVSLFDFFSFLLGVIVLVGSFLPPGFPYVCVCVALAHLVLWKWFSFCSLWFLFPVCVRAVLLLLCPLYIPIGVVLLSLCVWVHCIICKVAFMLITALFWEITRRIVVIPYRHFGTTYRSHLQGSRIQQNKNCLLP